MIAIAMAPRDTSEALTRIADVRNSVDVVEIRLDMMPKYELGPLITESQIPLVLTNRPKREGGNFEGSEKDRLKILTNCINFGASYIDIELDSISSIGERGASQLIVSHHNFQAMPDLSSVRARIESSGADIAKIVGLANSPLDSLAALKLFPQAMLPTISIAMGRDGLMSRILCLRYEKCLLSYATEDDDPGTAPGQLPVSRMINGFNAKTISFKTIPIAVLQYGERAEWLSIRLNSLFRQKHLDAVALPINSSGDNEHLISNMVDYGFMGFWEPERQLWTLGENSIQEQSVIDPEEAARIFSTTLATSEKRTID
tara:strand:- start:833 stop:1780 length:948 start_codon:yes stop_codon:yes gene_type:complete